MASSLKSGRPRSHKAASASSTNSSNPFGLLRAQFRMAWISVEAAAPSGPTSPPDIMAQSKPEICDKRRATMVLPVPGGPNNSRCRIGARNLRAPLILFASWSNLFPRSSGSIMPSVILVVFSTPPCPTVTSPSCPGPLLKSRSVMRSFQTKPSDHTINPDMENELSLTKAGRIKYCVRRRRASNAASLVVK